VQSPSLSQRLQDLIRRDGPLRFDRFQELALYDPDGGYYERAGRVGRAGDFVTGPSWHPAFGRTMARIARRLWEEEKEISEKGGETTPRGTREPIDIVDVGAGEGELLAAAHAALESWGIREEFRLIGVERSAVRRHLAAEKCAGVEWVRSFEEISRVRGLLVAYELFDALPVRALFFEGEELRERVVTLGPGGEGFAWGLAPCADGAELIERFQAQGIHLLRNQRLEVRSAAPRLAQAIGERLSSGLLLVFDYGAPAKALYGPSRPNGTLEAFVSHTVTRDVLSEPGSRDITAWVDFTELLDAFGSSGLEIHGLVSQARLLSAAGIASDAAAAKDAAERNALAALFAPGGMGELIRVAVASRGTRLGRSLVKWPGPGNEAS
jgi:SAM-dependent MidA family methyltransferase